MQGAELSDRRKDATAAAQSGPTIVHMLQIVLLQDDNSADSESSPKTLTIV